MRAACAGIVLMLAGCQSLATVPPLQAQTPAQWRNAGRTDAHENAAPAPDLNVWWHAFADAQLDALVAQALADNLTLAQAQSRLLAARAIAAATRGDFRPSIHAGTLNATAPDASASYLQADIDAQWELGLFGREQSTGWISRASVDSAIADVQNARVTLVAEVTRDYLALRSAQAQVVLLARVADAQRERRVLTQRRRALGLASDAELVRSQSDVASADAALTDPRIRADASAQQLALLCGRAEPQLALLALASPPKLTADAPASVPADLLRTRPDIHRAESAVLAAAGALGIAKADLYPRLSLLGAIISATTVSGGQLGFGRALGSFGPVIDIPLFDWGARRARVAAKDAELSAAVYGYRETVLEAIAETETALATWQAQSARATDLRAVVEAREHDQQAITRSRRLGLADGLDQAAASIALNQSRLDLLDAEQARALAYISLYKALGGAALIADAPH